MNVLPVLDLQYGVIVRGVAGERAKYQPLQSCLVPEVTPTALAKVFREQFGLHECYVADLDAIANRAVNAAVYRELLQAGCSLILDAGIGSLAKYLALLTQLPRETLPQLSFVVGLESVTRLADLEVLLHQPWMHPPLFSLDLRGGQPMTRIAEWQSAPPRQIAEDVIRLGFKRLIVLDLADVGVARGTGTLPLVRALKSAHAQLELISGGGVRNAADLAQLAAAGCSSALVASALHNGSLTAAEICKFRSDAPRVKEQQ